MRYRTLRLPLLLTVVLLLLLAACRPAAPGDQPTATNAPATATTSPTEAAPTAAATAAATATTEPAPEPTPTLEMDEPLPDLEPIRAELATRLEIAPDDISVGSAELLPSPDLCLGIYDGSSDCYRVALLANGQSYNFHINSAGDFTGLVDSIPAGPGQIVITFGRDNCQVGALRLEAPPVGLGPCGSEFTFFDYAGDAAAAQAELQRILDAYVPFNAVTPSGFISVGGNGAGDPSEQELEEIGAWVRSVISDAVAQGPADDALCSRLARPALVIQVQGRLAITNPFSGDQCDLQLPGEFHGAMQAAGGFLYFQDSEDGEQIIRELSPDGTLRPLDVTRTDPAEQSLLGFAVSPNGQQIAWSTATQTGEPGMVSSLHVAPVHGDTAETIISGLSREDGRGLIPVRFDESGLLLAYTLQPIGIGGSWPTFVGRYDSVFTIAVDGGETLQAFDCPDLGLFLCIGDFRLQDGALSAIAYVNANTIEVVDGAGSAIASIQPDAEYVAYPSFNAAGDLLVYTAAIGEDDGGAPFALPGAYYHVAPPYDGEQALIAQQDGLLPPYQWFDDQHLIIGFGDAAGAWGTALLGLDGSITRIEPWPGAAAVTVIHPLP